jgi:hypothetical protein
MLPLTIRLALTSRSLDRSRGNGDQQLRERGDRQPRRPPALPARSHRQVRIE